MNKVKKRINNLLWFGWGEFQPKNKENPNKTKD